MVINTDMLRLAGNNDSMMAAVIGHELGHLKAEHVTKGANTATAISFIGALLGAAVDINQAKQGHDTYGLGSAIGRSRFRARQCKIFSGSRTGSG
ncbi:M48 family metalloprotease [Polaromonas sp. P1(28)-13]|nr:M48 family metalloprotease [Polaromonas sp. P1(28)-13]